MPITGMDDLKKKKGNTTAHNTWQSVGNFKFEKIEDPFVDLYKVQNRAVRDESDIQLGAIVRFRDLKKDVHVNEQETVFLGLDCPDGFMKPRGHTLSNTVKVLTKSPSEPFMRICDIRHIEKVNDTGDVQQNIKFLEFHSGYGENFTKNLVGLRIGGMWATMSLKEFMELENAHKGIEGAATAFTDALSKLGSGDYIESRGNVKIMNMETAGMFEEMNEAARQEFERQQAREARLRRFGSNSINPYFVSV